MSENEYRAEAQATLDPHAHEGVVGGGRIQLVTLELTDDDDLTDDAGEPVGRRPAVRCDLRAHEARLLAYTLLVLAERADMRTFVPDHCDVRARARAAARAAAADSLA